MRSKSVGRHCESAKSVGSHEAKNFTRTKIIHANNFEKQSNDYKKNLKSMILIFAVSYWIIYCRSKPWTFPEFVPTLIACFPLHLHWLNQQTWWSCEVVRFELCWSGVTYVSDSYPSLRSPRIWCIALSEKLKSSRKSDNEWGKGCVDAAVAFLTQTWISAIVEMIVETPGTASRTNSKATCTKIVTTNDDRILRDYA